MLEQYEERKAASDVRESSQMRKKGLLWMITGDWCQRHCRQRRTIFGMWASISQHKRRGKTARKKGKPSLKMRHQSGQWLATRSDPFSFSCAAICLQSNHRSFTSFNGRIYGVFHFFWPSRCLCACVCVNTGVSAVATLSRPTVGLFFLLDRQPADPGHTGTRPLIC